ncbi:protein kinase [Aggregicoccus sp. 17bor-14]|uniref:serine/threonine-protein kinase n=1 Tax=Myxococcaceae TaxID=31 RepID=UPI00129D04A2|nr:MULTISPECIES: serine/threonine-protein kinase [Myxococcaceae]MBF5044217.1 serine/threonine protein kinase [Simulacricoccus sp. 17bor-14]MRI89967.1 protein kinase [Aggregicoccus sp. 17bor-14]
MSQPRYVTLGSLHAGKGSRAVLGWSLDSARPVVLVRAPDALVQDPALLEELRRETARACVLEHPNILRVHGLAALEGGYARVTEFADGEPLRQVLERVGRLSVAHAVRLAADVAMGVHYAHLAGNDDGTPLVHGDLRPETLMLGFDGACKVTGYGALGVAPREPEGRRVRNRRRYCAPEQLLGGRSAVTVQSDVLLLALTVFECLAGEHPFAHASDLDAALLLEPLPARPDLIPGPLDAVLRRACAKRAEDRYPSMLALRDALLAAAEPHASAQELAALMARAFPPEDPARAARAALIARAPSPHVEAPLVGSPLELLPPPAPRRRPEPAAPAEPATPAELPRAAPVGLMLAGAAGLALLVAGILWAVRGPGPREATGASVLPDAGAPAALAAAPAPSASPADAGAPLAELDLVVEPAVEVWLGETSLGRTPLKASLPPGRHLLALRNPALGIYTARAVTVGASGRVAQSVYLARGYVVVSAPEGASIRVDGKAYGSAPVGELALYEGEHHLVVDAAGARWQQGFRLEPNQRVRFDVAFETP